MKMIKKGKKQYHLILEMMKKKRKRKK